jgi:hypothetical protein
MKKTILIVALVVLALGAVGVGVVLAQGGGQLPYGWMTNMMGGNGYGSMHNYVEQAMAAKLGITEEEVEKELVTKPMYQIALDHGIQQADLATFLNEVHKDAFAQAVKDGLMTQQQADWMLQHMQNRFDGNGGCPMWNNGQSGPVKRGSLPSANGNTTGYGPGMMGGNGFGPGGMMGNGWGWQNP